MARLYSNENFPIPVVEALRVLGHDVVTIQDQGRAGEAVPDLEVLEFATSTDRDVLTLNRRDFIRLHQQRPARAGIIVGTVDPDFAGQAQRVHDAIQAISDPRGRPIRVHRPTT